jgi:hypothetical protein
VNDEIRRPLAVLPSTKYQALNTPSTPCPRDNVYFPMTPDQLAGALQEFLTASRHGMMLEENEVIFDLESARYSISAERGRCLLHVWSVERNVVREVVDIQSQKDALQLSVRKFGQAKPHKLLVCRERDQRSPAARKTARTRYARAIEKAVQQQFPGWVTSKLATSMDLKRSFSPVYARGLLRHGNSAQAVLGVNHEETQAAVDAALTFGLLWLEDCRQRAAGRMTIEGLRVYAPAGRSATLQLRMAHLNHQRARFELCEFDETTNAVTEINIEAATELESRLSPLPDSAQAQRDFADAIARIRALAPQAELAILSPGEISFRLHGLEFARARVPANSKPTLPEIIFGLSGFEALLTPETDAAFQRFVTEIAEGRRAQANHRDRLWRIYPERWLESSIVKDIAVIYSHLQHTHVYSQVPAFSASDRSLIDVLTCTRAGRLAVLELKADEDIHLPLQGLDYWARVQRRHARGDFQKNGYFSGVHLSPDPPLLFLVAPALRVHPAVETILSYLSPDIEWRLAGLDERWREGIHVVFRKATGKAAIE